VVRALRLVGWVTGVMLLALPALAQSDAPSPDHPSPSRWIGPFGGDLHASVTVATDYSQSGISTTENRPAFQGEIDWYSPYLLANGPPLRFYTTASITNVSFPNGGPGEEIDVGTGFKLNLLEKRLVIDLGYIRYLFPSYPADLGYEYGDWSAKVDYDFGPFIASARLRYSPDTTLHAGHAWNKRGLVTVPLTFVPMPQGAQLKIYGSLGNVWVEKPEVLDLSRNDWWYWQIGLVVSVTPLKLDLTLAYTDTNLASEDCGFTRACEGRFFMSVTKVF
jgi:uncharacterized protein (TIGR02001 family)